MCGISGIIYKRPQSNGPAPVGEDLVKMLDSLAHRGRDSTGISVVGQDLEDDIIVRIWTNSDHIEEVTARVEDALARVGCVVGSSRSWGQFLRLTLRYEGDIPALAEALVGIEDVAIHSIGEASEVVKDIGTASAMELKHGVGELRGTHGIGHVRMATESMVDISHAHPFWAFPFPDVSVVHNGQLTNYHKLKRHYEDEGHWFQTDNDSELIAVYLAAQIADGRSLDQALNRSLDDLDGTFTYLVSTRDGIGYAKDRWSAKPLVTMETSDVVALASEEVALRSVFSEEIDRVEPQQGEVMTWSV